MSTDDRDTPPPAGRVREHGWSVRAGKVVPAALLLAAVLVVAGFASGWKEYTWGARIGTFGSGLVVLGLGVAWGRRHHRATPPSSVEEGSTFSHRGVAIWVAALVVAAAWDVCGLLTPPNRNHLTLSALELAYRPLHSLMFVSWLFAGWVLASTPLRRRRS